MNPEKPSLNKDIKKVYTPTPLEVAHIRKSHGVRGEMLVDLDEKYVHLFEPGLILLLGERQRELTLTSIRKHKNGYLLMFEEINSPEEVSQNRFKKLFLPDVVIQKHHPDTGYLEHQILGLRVVTDDDVFLGLVSEILKTGANDVYIVENSKGEILLPAISDVIINIDIERKELLVHLIPGLIDNS